MPKNEPTLPFEAEPDDTIRARLHKALNPVYIQELIEKGGPRPGQFRKHVFDFTDGVRMIVSIERPNVAADKVLHVSFSVVDGAYSSMEAFMARITNGVAELFPGLKVRNRVLTKVAAHFICDPPGK